MIDVFTLPVLSPAVQGAFRTSYGVLQVLFLISLLPDANRFFLCRRWGGYIDDGPTNGLLQNPFCMPMVLAVWLASAVAIAGGWFVLVASAVNAALCYYFFIAMRWRGLQRGFGAPGFISYWGANAVCLLATTRALAPSQSPLGVLTLQVDLAFIIFSAGWYKLRSGYARNDGMEYGLVNPQWGRFWGPLSKLSPTHWIFVFSNQAAWSVELAAALLMLVPGLRWVGGLLLIASFAYVGFLSRLGVLPAQVIVCGFLFFTVDSPPDRWIQSLAGSIPPVDNALSFPIPWLESTIRCVLWGYLALRPLAHFGLMRNFFGRRRLPGLLQPILETYTNLFGIILWKVFASDLTRFWIQIDRRPRGQGHDISVAQWGRVRRFDQVVEAITATCVFMTRLYYPSRPEIFRDRLLAYARTIPHEPDERLVFQWVEIIKNRDGFDHRPTMEFVVDVQSETIDELPLTTPSTDRRGALGHEAVRQGSYLPLDAIG